MRADAGAAAVELLKKIRSIDPESEPEMYDQTQAEMKQLTTAADERIKVLLSAEQFQRLQQLAWRSSGSAIILDADFTADLKLDAAQLARIDDVRNHRNESSPARSAGESLATVARNRIAAMRRSCDELLGALTDEQRAAYQQKLGPPAETDATQIGQHVFALLDADGDEQLTADEWESADAARLLSEWRIRNRVELPLTREDFVQGFVAARAATRSRTLPSF